MKNLTQSQQDVIDFITNQFQTLNESNCQISFNVLDVNKLNEETNRIAIGKKELAIHNSAMEKIRLSLYKDFCNKLNEDFKNGNLPFTATERNQSWHTGIEIKCTKNFDYNSIRVEIKSINQSPTPEFGTKCIGHEYTYSYNSFIQPTYKTPQELMSCEYIQKRLLEIIEKHNRLK